MKYADKYDREIDLDLDEGVELVVQGFMKEGELRYRDQLIKILQRTAEIMSEGEGEGYKPKLTIDALIKIVETEDENENEVEDA